VDFLVTLWIATLDFEDERLKRTQYVASRTENWHDWCRGWNVVPRSPWRGAGDDWWRPTRRCRPLSSGKNISREDDRIFQSHEKKLWMEVGERPQGLGDVGENLDASLK
jgi:hypothetical protein